MAIPVVSILMPVYNVGPYIKEAIQSILNQTFKDLELIIINDASTDDTGKVIEGFKDKRIVYLRNNSNIKIVESLNKGLKYVRGEFIARMDGDDLSNPDRIKKQVSFLDTNADIGACGTSINKFGTVKGTINAIEDPKEVKYGLSFNAALPGATMVVRTEILKGNDIYYSKKHPFAEDYHFLTRLSQVTQLASIPDVLYQYRIHDTNISSKKAFQIKNDAAQVRYEYLLNNLGNIFSNEVLKEAAFAWKNNDEFLDLDKLDQLLKVYESFYTMVFGSLSNKGTGAAGKIIDEYFFYLMRYLVKKDKWLIPYYFKRRLYNFSPNQIIRLIGTNVLKR